jgi:hypothetical protein
MMRPPFARSAARTQRAIAVLAAALAAACGGGGGGNGPPYHVSGTMTSAAGSAVDSDTADAKAPFARNDSAGEAQAIGNPVSLGGHANRAGVGPCGGPTTF